MAGKIIGGFDQTREQVLADREFWKSVEPEGYQLFGWTYRYAATFLTSSGKELEITDEHLRFFKAGYYADDHGPT